MAQSGWYDDPDGTPGRVRFWDGTQWTTDTMAKPGAPDQTAVLPPLYGGSGYTAPSYPTAWGTSSPQPPPSPSPPKSNRAPLVLAIVALLVLGSIAAFALPGLLASKTSAPRPSASTHPTYAASTPPKRPSAAPISATAQPSPELNVRDCPDSETGLISDGYVTVTIPENWSTDVFNDGPWSCSMYAEYAVSSHWSWLAVVGSTPADENHTSAEVASTAWEWNVADNYTNVTSSRLTKQGEVTVAGHKGYQLTGEARVSETDAVLGDTVEILVLEMPDGTRSTIMTLRTIGDAKAKAATDAIWASLSVA